MHTISHQPYAANQVSVGSHMLAGSQHHHMTSPLTSHVGASNGAVGPGPTGTHSQKQLKIRKTTQKISKFLIFNNE